MLKNVKKVVSFILCLVFAAQFLVFAEDTPSLLTDIQKEQYILNRLNVLKTSNDDDLNSVVSRAEFARYVASMLKLPESNNIIYFVDVPKSYWAAGSINALVEYGVIEGTYGQRFEPEEPVTYEQACKMLVSALGYKAYALSVSNKGMAGYIAIAQRIGLNVKVKNVQALTKYDAIQMIYKAMDTEIASSYVINDGYTRSVVEKGKTIFSEYHDVYFVEGQVEYAYGESIMSNYSAGEDVVIIDGVTYTVDAGYPFDGFLGHEVEVAYIENAEDERILIYAEKHHSQSIVIQSDLVDSFDLSNYVIRYYESAESNRLSSQKIERGAVVVYNGRVLEGRLTDVLNQFISSEKKGTIELIEGKGSSNVSIVIIKSYENFVIGNYDAEKEILYNYYDNTKTVDLKPFKIIKITDGTGNSAFLPSVYPTPVAVAKSDDEYMIHIIVYKEKVTVTLEAKNESEGTIQIDGTDYKVDKAIYPYVWDTITLNDEYTIIYDMFGEIVYISKVNDAGMQIGYMRKITAVKKISDYDLYISVYQQDKMFHDYRIADHVTIDEVSYKLKDYKKLLMAFPGMGNITEDNGKLTIPVSRQIIRFKLNADNEITSIDTYIVNEGVENADTSLTRKCDGSSEIIYNGTLKRFGLGDIYDPNITKIFVVPKTNENGDIVIKGQTRTDDLLYYNTAYSFVTDQNYAIETYYFDHSNLVVDVLVVNVEPLDQSPNVYMFDKLTRGVNPDGESCIKINCAGNVSFFVDDLCSEEVKKLKKGDLFRVDMDYLGTTAFTIEKMYDAETKEFQNGGANKYWYAGTYNPQGGWTWRQYEAQLTKSYPYEVVGTFIRSSYELADARFGITNEVINASGINIIVYDKARDKIYTGGISDITGYRHAGEDCPIIVVNNNKTAIKQIFVYK